MPVSDADVWRAAVLLVGRHGSAAPTHAALRADELMAAGDTKGWTVWDRICCAVEELLRDEPAEGETLH